jgi:hypothetical protein
MTTLLLLAIVITAIAGIASLYAGIKAMTAKNADLAVTGPKNPRAPGQGWD